MNLKCLVCLLIIIGSAIQTIHAQIANTNAIVGPNQSGETNEWRFQKLENQVEEVRRDELNYKIEKEVIEKNYGSYTQTMGTILTLLFGVFAIFGFFGLRDLSGIKKEFLAELDKLRDVRRDFEVKATDFAAKQENVENEFKKLYQQSEEQNKKLKVLEFREKISTLVANGNYQWALENLAVALSFDPNHPVLLGQKGLCLWRINDLSNALIVIKEALQADPRNETTLENCLELMLVQKDFVGYAELLSKNLQKVQSIRNGMLFKYLQALELHQKDDVAGLKKLVSEVLVPGANSKSEMKMVNWVFDDLRNYLRDQPQTPKREILLTLTDVLDGKLSPKEGLVKLGLT